MNGSGDLVSVSIIAGPIERRPGMSSFGSLVRMGDGNIYFQIPPEVAQQWLPVITEIAGEKA